MFTILRIISESDYDYREYAPYLILTSLLPFSLIPRIDLYFSTLYFDWASQAPVILGLI